jgi:hypothetical protein
MAKTVAIATLGLLVVAARGQADEKKIPLDQAPKAVVDAVKARFAGAKLTGAEMETEDGKTTYEINIEFNGQKIDVELTPDGKITEIEKQIDAKAMSKAATDALAEKYPQATFKKIEEVIKVKDGEEKLDYYEVLLVTAANKKFEVSVTPEGKIAKEEDKNKEKKE